MSSGLIAVIITGLAFFGGVGFFAFMMGKEVMRDDKAVKT